MPKINISDEAYRRLKLAAVLADTTLTGYVDYLTLPDLKHQGRALVHLTRAQRSLNEKKEETNE